MKVQFDIFCLVKIDILMDLDHRKSLCVKLSWGDMDEKEGGGELGLKKQKEEVKGVAANGTWLLISRHYDRLKSVT